MTIERLHRLLETYGARRLSQLYSIYELRRALWPPFFRTVQLHKRQLEFLDAVRSLPWQAFVHTGEDPAEWSSGVAWVRASHDTWVIPLELSSELLLDGVLAPGAWQLYLGANSVDPGPLPDLFRSNLDDICEFVAGHSIPVLIDAWHDNSEWRVVLEPSAVPAVAAA